LDQISPPRYLRLELRRRSRLDLRRRSRMKLRRRRRMELRRRRQPNPSSWNQEQLPECSVWSGEKIGAVEYDEKEERLGLFLQNMT
jgi:hypothetical protein